MKFNSVACGFSPMKILFSDYLKSLISRIMKFMYFSIKYRNSDIILKKTTLYLKPFVLLQSHLLLCWNGFCDISVPLCYVSVTLSKKILDIHPRSDSMEFHGIGGGSSDWLGGCGGMLPLKTFDKGYHLVTNDVFLKIIHNLESFIFHNVIHTC